MPFSQQHFDPSIGCTKDSRFATLADAIACDAWLRSRPMAGLRTFGNNNLWPPPGGNTYGDPVPLPLPTRGGGVQANLSLGDVGRRVVDTAVDIGLTYVKNKLTGNQVVPTGTNNTFSGPLVPEQKCPEGQLGVPPACFDLVPGGATSGGGMLVTPGEAVLGRYGAALQPSTQGRTVRRCMRGMVLGNDGLCYNRGDLKRNERWWIPGRKPLLTGGELNAISKASRAANKLKTQQKRLQKLGLLPKATSRGRGRSAGVPGLRQLQPGIVQIQQE